MDDRRSDPPGRRAKPGWPTAGHLDRGRTGGPARYCHRRNRHLDCRRGPGRGPVLPRRPSGALNAGIALAASSFALQPGNNSPTGIATDGQTIWVSDDAADQVYVYGLDGTHLGQWQLDTNNTDPSGITNDPSGGEDLWVVDRADLLVYQYDMGTTQVDAGLGAVATFTLASENLQPEGIADPDKIFDRVLMINVHGSSYDSDGYNIYQTLLIAGADATYVDLNLNGEVAAELSSHVSDYFDQLWVFDLSALSDNYPADWQAIASWYDAASAQGDHLRRSDNFVVLEGTLARRRYRG